MPYELIVILTLGVAFWALETRALMMRASASTSPRTGDGSSHISYVMMWICCFGFMAVYAVLVAMKNGLRYLWYLGLGAVMFGLIAAVLVLWAGWMKAARLFCGPCPDGLCDGHLCFRQRLVSADKQFIIDQHHCSECGTLVEERTPTWLIEQEERTGRMPFSPAGSNWP